MTLRFWILGSGAGFCALFNLLFVSDSLSFYSMHNSLFWGVNGAFLLFSFWSLFYLYQSISMPIASLLEAVRLINKEDLSVQVLKPKGNEFCFLIENFNQFIKKIQKKSLEMQHSKTMNNEFISNVSHELRTPLTSIGGYTKLVASGDAGPVTPTQKEFLDIIDYNVERLMELINDFLDFQQMETEKIQLELKSHDLVLLLKECLSTFKIIAQNKKLGLELKGSLEPVFVSGDRHRLTQIFMNLLSNAVKYTQTGSIEVEFVRSNYSVAVQVRDTGLGISPEDQINLFQKFYRTRSGLSSGETGSGLGLMIVKKLIDLHGGSVSIESTPGKGSLFTVQFPLPIPEPIATPKNKITPYYSKNIKNVWIIDADLKAAQEYQDFLIHHPELQASKGMKIQLFEKVAIVPEQSVNSQPDLVILDPLDTMSMYELRKKIKTDTPVLVLSSTIDSPLALAEGAFAWLKKPVNKNDFDSAIQALVTKQGWRVLLADSNTDLRLLLKRALEKCGLRVDDLDRGNAVINRIEKERYDLVLLDMHLQDVPGVDVLKIIHRVPEYQSLPIVMMSSVEKDVPSEKELMSWGTSKFVPKYRGLSYIVDNVNQYLEDQKFLEKYH
jgi:signal transduction histidine kinase/DNA-binding response OmpR family regulator